MSIATTTICSQIYTYADTLEDNQYLKDFDTIKLVGYNASKNDNDEVDSSNQFEFSVNGSILDDILNGINHNNFPTTYDMRKLGLVTKTEYQAHNGTCWAFCTTESAVSSLLGSSPFTNFSEWHLAYFTYTGDDAIEFYLRGSNADPFQKGGNSTFATSTLSKWNGFVSEDVVPYGTSTTLDESLKNVSEYHLTDAYSFNSSLDLTNIKTYNQANVKRMILDGNSVSVNLYYNGSYYDSDNHSYYCPTNSDTSNHGVTIVGWDDDYYYYDSLTEKPSNKGAWICKNSWGYDFGDYGYFWLSYDNATMVNATAYIVESSQDYSNNYYYDDYGWTTSINSLNEDGFRGRYSDYAGNVFTAKSDENVGAVSFYTTDYQTEYTISIYTDVQDTNSPIGKLVSTQSGTQAYMGYHTVKLNTPVSVEAGEKYSVVIKFKNPTYKNTIAVDSSMNFIQYGELNSYNVSQESIAKHSNTGESFISNDGKTWTDIHSVTGVMTQYDQDFDYSYTPDFDYSTLSNYKASAVSTLGNVCIKAFTNPTDKVYYSKYSGSLTEGDTIELSTNYNSQDATIYYTLDGSKPTKDSLVYSKPIEYTGKDMTISAVACTNGTMGTVYTQEYTLAKAVVSSMCIKEYDGKEYTFNEVSVQDKGVPTTNIVYHCNEDTTSINVFAITNGSATIKEDTLTSGHQSDTIPLTDKVTTIPISVHKDGYQGTDYTLTIVKGEDTEPLLGDVNQDGTIDYSDLLLLKKHIIMEYSSKDILSTEDLNQDSTINVLDVIALKQILIAN